MLPEWLTILIPGVGTAALAILSGAGGSALLDLYWKPRAERRRAAALVHADVLINMQLILYFSHVRQYQPRAIPEDMKLSRLGFDTAAELVSALPTEMLRDVIVLYNRIQESNRNVELYASALTAYEALAPEALGRDKLERYMNSIIDVFNTGLDRTMDSCRKVGGPLEALAGIVADRNEKPRDFAAEARALMEGREARIRALEEMDGKQR